MSESGVENKKIDPHLNLKNTFEEFQKKQLKLEDIAFKGLNEVNASNISDNLFSISKDITPPFIPEIKQISFKRKTIAFDPNITSSLKQFSQKVINIDRNSVHPNPEGKKINFYDVITIMHLIKKFINILMSVATVRKIKFLNMKHFELINDKCSFFNFSNNKPIDSINLNSKNRVFKIIYLYLVNFKINVFQPFHAIVMLLNAINICIYFSFLFLVPILICFNIIISEEELGLSQNFYNNSIIIISVLHIIEIFVNFNKSFYSKGELITNRSLIASFYVKNYFLYDLISVICLFSAIFHLSIENLIESNILYLILYLCFKRKKIMNIIKQMEEFFIVDQTYFNIYELIKLFIRIIIIAHFAACIWYSMTLNKTNNEITWMQKLNISDANWKIKYMHSFYFIIITMNTVGYGDITPQNPKEIIFCIFFVFLACSLFAYCINCVGNIVKEIHHRESGFRADLFSINEFMRNKKISKILQIRIRKYIEYIWKEEKMQNIEFSNKVINKLSNSLKSDLMFEAIGPYIADIDLFTTKFSEKSLRSLIDIVTEERFTPNEIIFEKGNCENHDMFIIKKGNVEIFVENELNEEKHILMNLGEGKIFGEISFFSEMGRSASVRSTDFTTLIRISQEKFKQIIKENSNDYEKFIQMKDSIRLYNKFDSMLINCYSCNKSDHLITNCPLLKPIFVKDIIIGRHNYSEMQDRLFKIRKKYQRRNALKCYKINKSDYFIEKFNANLSDVEEIESEDSNTGSKEEINYKRKKNKLNTVKIDSLSNVEVDYNFSLEKCEDIHKNTGENSGKPTDLLSSTLAKQNKFSNVSKSFNKSNTNNTLTFNESEKQNESINKLDNQKKNTNNELTCENLTNKSDFKDKSILANNSFVQNEKKIHKDYKDDNTNILFDRLKIYPFYFPYNNADKIIDNFNFKNFQLLKKKKKTHLIIDQSVNSSPSKFFVTSKISSKTISEKQETNSILKKKNVLRKKSNVIFDWKDDLRKIQKMKKKNHKNIRLWDLIRDYLIKKLGKLIKIRY